MGVFWWATPTKTHPLSLELRNSAYIQISAMDREALQAIIIGLAGRLRER